MPRSTPLPDLPPCGLTAAALRRRLNLAVRAYARWRRPDYAELAAACIERLLAHPDTDLAPAQRCTARALACHWRRVAWCGACANPGRGAKRR